MNWNKFKLWSLVFFLLSFFGCSTVPLTGRKQLSLVDDNTMQQQASLAYKELLNDPKTKVIKGTSNTVMVQNVGTKIAKAVERYLQENGYANQYQFNWEFNLIDDKQVNAWCMPGGKVAVYTGILPVTKNEAGLATVLGHEIAHAIARHSSERASQMLAAQGVGVGVGLATQKKSQMLQVAVNQLYGVGSQVAILSYSRKQESEADRMGLTFMAMAGYNPNEAVTFWQRMAASSSSTQKPPEFLSTHPSDERRIADIKNLIPEAMRHYTK